MSAETENSETKDEVRSATVSMLAEDEEDKLEARELAASNRAAKQAAKRTGQLRSAADGRRVRRQRWLWRDKIPLGHLSLLAGRGGTGKSTITADVAAKVTKGFLSGDLVARSNTVIMVCSEDKWEESILPRLIAAGADLNRVLEYTVTYDGDQIGVSILDDLDDLREKIIATGARLLVLDPLISRMGKLDINSETEIRAVLDPLDALARETGVTILALMHFNKSGNADPMLSLMGSAAFGNVARSVLVTAKYELDGEQDMYAFGIGKCNLTADRSLQLYRIEGNIEVGRDPDDDSPVMSTRIGWLDKLEQFTLTDVLAGPSKSDTRKNEREAQMAALTDFARDYLAGHDGIVRVDDLKFQAAAEGFDPEKLAKVRALVPASFGRISGEANGWYWCDPDTTPEMATKYFANRRATPPSQVNGASTAAEKKLLKKVDTQPF